VEVKYVAFHLDSVLRLSSGTEGGAAGSYFDLAAGLSERMMVSCANATPERTHVKRQLSDTFVAPRFRPSIYPTEPFRSYPTDLFRYPIIAGGMSSTLTSAAAVVPLQLGGLLSEPLGQALAVIVAIAIVVLVGRIALKIAWRLVTIAAVVVGALLLLSFFGISVL
jgi:hypothetical protein